MKNKRSALFISIFLLLAVALNGCAGGSTSRMAAAGWAGVAADEETAYLAYNSHVYAISLENGNERWRFPAEADPKISFYAAPALTIDGQLIIGGYNNILYSLNPINGQLNWTFEQSDGRFIGGPLATENGIFAPSTDHNLYALEFDGKTMWPAFETGEQIWTAPATDFECACIYVASMDHRIYAIDAQSGAESWQTVDLGGAIVGTPSLSPDRILYTGTFAKEIIALDAKNGNELWRFSTLDWVWSSPALDETTLYVGDLSGTLYAVDRQTGNQLWQIQTESSIVGKPLITDSTIYFTNEAGSITAIDSKGSARWTKTFEGNTHAGPVAAGELVLVATSQPEALLIAFNANGTQKWLFGEAQ